MARHFNIMRNRITRKVSRIAVIAAVWGAVLNPAVAAQEKYDDVRKLFEQQQYETALKLLLRKQSSDAADSEMYLLLAKAYLETGAGIAAEASIERARRLGADYAGTAILFAKSLLLQGKYADALAAIRGVTISQSEQVVAYIIAGDANFALKNMREARRNYELARQHDAENFQAYLGLARLEMREGNLNKASELVRSAAEYGANNTMVHYTWGLVARYTGKMDEAEQHFIEARRLFPANIMANLELASISVDRGALEEAEEYLDGVYAVAPNYPMALYLSSVIMASRGQFEQAYGLLNKARDITENYLPAMYIRGLLAYQLGHYSVAASNLERVIQTLPNSLSPRMALAGTYLRQERAQAAYRVLEPILETGKPDTNVIAMAAAASMAAGQPKRGHDLYELLAEEESKTPDDVLKGLASKLALARFVAGNSTSAANAILTQPPTEGVDVRELGVLGGIQLRSGDYEGAQLTIDKILAALPDRALGYNMRGTLEYQKGDFTQALNSFKQAISKNPDYYTATRNKALAEVRLEQYADAEKDLKSLLKAQPTDARAKALLGRVLLRQKKGEEAVSYFEEAIRVIPGSPDMEADYAEALAIAGQTARAIEQARETAVLVSDRPDLLKRMGLLLLDLNQARLAVRPLSRFVAFNPDNGEAHMLHGRALLALGLNTGAKISFARAEKAEFNKPDQGRIVWYLFAVDAFSGKYGEALAVLSKLDPALKPDDIKSSVIGDALVAAGRYDEAIDAYTASIQRAPTSDLAIGLASVYERQNRGQKGIEVLEDYVKTYPGDRAARMALGNMLEKAGLPGAATSQYEAVLRAGVADAHVVARLARAYLRLGNKKSVPLAERAYLIMPEDPFILDIYGWVMLQANRDAELAEKAISKASRRAPSVALYRYHLGMTYLAQGRRGLALDTLRQAVRLDPNFEEADDANRQITLLE
ncbi:XrtA/PEP-CTERM system TPR-repeat protein PrsT [Kordiimonas aestuarii]|uniref:XrtA/PEP-CTERM system TPR-repeat protein PrsT n=1 Tax=Kordiimonas aestuarii TaxID=1005925 RepID=UPI0021D327B8|nr:XrtA/PEP-CTERM system TPR-repeat protein PrsT [Kordiimonas aestuarii]